MRFGGRLSGMTVQSPNLFQARPESNQSPVRVSSEQLVGKKRQLRTAKGQMATQFSADVLLLFSFSFPFRRNKNKTGHLIGSSLASANHVKTARVAMPTPRTNRAKKKKIDTAGG